jgi:hypothetical protein
LPMLGTQSPWAGSDLYRANPAVTRDLGYSGLIRRTAPFNRLLWHAWGCGGSILTRIITGVQLTKFDDSRWQRNPHFRGPPNVVYSFVLGIKWKLRMFRFRICMMPPWHPWEFCAIQDGVQDGRQFEPTFRTPLLFNIERWFWCQTLCFWGPGIHWND